MIYQFIHACLLMRTIRKSDEKSINHLLEGIRKNRMSFQTMILKKAGAWGGKVIGGGGSDDSS